MTRISAMLPVIDGVAVYAALTGAADSARCDGDERSRSQMMADELVARITGRRATTAPAPVPAESGNEHPSEHGSERGDPDGRDDPGEHADPAGSRASTGRGESAGVFGEPTRQTLTLNMVITDRTLLAGDSEPAHLEGYGVVPAGWARERIAAIIDHAETDPCTTVLIRRLFTTPGAGDVVAMESRSRTAPGGLAELIRLRDQTCRIPYCDARIRHTDHLTRWRDGGATSAANLAGTCEAHNYVHEDPGWGHTRTGDPGRTHGARRRNPDQRHTFTVTIPTGHTYPSTAPAPPGTAA